ncbi:RadC family protein [Stenoxybacter acetivorans]|uniref:RadC family protein n=1 Tax=Stenoxybacter acetivorans TaxID=422441 RepID=UPI00056C1E69|nr:DNA repair protein RadC [Stenoxybacter acetivorans]
MSIKDWPTSERPREKLLTLGASSLSDAELLAILLRTGIQGCSAVALARDLLSHFGGLSALFQADSAALCACKGMGMASFTQFAVVREIGKRLLSEEITQTPIFNRPKTVADYLRLRIGHEKVEVSLALLLNQQNQLLHTEELTRGTVNANTVYVREIAALALRQHAAAVIVAHNHPGGHAVPSAEDIAFTHRLQKALNLLDIRLLDHFIVTKDNAVSMAQSGCLKAE